MGCSIIFPWLFSFFLCQDKKKSSIKIHANPVSDQLICEFINSNAEDISITLVNSLGKIAYKNVISSHLGYKKHLIDVSMLSQGVYYL